MHLVYSCNSLNVFLESTRSTSDITPYRLDEYLERSRKFLDASRQSLRSASACPSPPFISGPRLNAAPCQSRRGKSSGLLDSWADTSAPSTLAAANMCPLNHQQRQLIHVGCDYGGTLHTR